MGKNGYVLLNYVVSSFGPPLNPLYQTSLPILQLLGVLSTNCSPLSPTPLAQSANIPTSLFAQSGHFTGNT